MPSKPYILICGNLAWAHNDLESMFADIAIPLPLTSQSRSQFFSTLTTSPYKDIVGIYRHNGSADKIGVFDAELVNALPASVRWIAHNGAGYDQIDVKACIDRGIKVSNTPGAVNEATATTALYLLLSTARQFSPSERSLRSLHWKTRLPQTIGHDPSALTLGILGMGGIGACFARMARAALGMRVLYYSRTRKLELERTIVGAADGGAGIQYIPDLETFLRSVDVISVHIALKDETVGFVGEREIRTMRRGSILLNTARGKVVDEEALIAALEDGHLSAAGLDVYPSEPHVNPRLLTIPSITLLPHMGTETVESQHKMEVRALGNLRDFLVSGSGFDLVPEMVNLDFEHPHLTNQESESDHHQTDILFQSPPSESVSELLSNVSPPIIGYRASDITPRL